MVYHVIYYGMVNFSYLSNVLSIYLFDKVRGVMSKSKIIKDIVNEEVPLSQSLTRLQVIAYDLKNKSLERWAEDELTGYTDEENVPEYRLKHSINFNYSGINNMVHLVKNVNLNPSLLGTDVLEQTVNISFKQSVSALESLLQEEGNSIYLDRSIYATEVEKNSNGAIQCMSIRQIVSKSDVQAILAEIKNRLLKSLLLLEEEFGCLDELDINIENEPSAKIKRINYEINNSILNIQEDFSENREDSLYNKITWKIIIPIVVAVSGSLLTIYLKFVLNLF